MTSPRDAGLVLAGKRVWVAGHKGMVGSALVERLGQEGCEILSVERTDVDLRRQARTERWLAANRPHLIIIAAGIVGGIEANRSRPAEFIYDNLAIVTNIIHAAWRLGVEKLVLIGSSAVYAVRATADKRGCLVDGSARSDPRVVRHGQDFRNKAMPSLSRAVWM